MKRILRTLLAALVVVLSLPRPSPGRRRPDAEGENRRQARDARDHDSRRAEMGRQSGRTPTS